MTNPPNYEPKVIMAEDLKQIPLLICCLGGPVASVILAIFFPFFRYLLNFGTVVITILLFFGMMAAKDDLEAGVERPRPKRRINIPDWVPNIFFAFMVIMTAGLRLGWYLIPVCWVACWIFYYNFRNFVRKTYKD